MVYEKKPYGFTFKPFSFPFCWVKVIFVKKGHRNSLHIHHDRAEYVWKFPFTFLHIKKDEPHRAFPGLYIEFAYGNTYEEDIVRLEDDYARI